MAPESEIKKVKLDCEALKEEMVNSRKDSLELEQEIKNKENLLADIEKEISLRLSEREKIRHIEKET